MTEKTTKLRPDQRIIQALSHPLRHRILQELNVRVASARELAEDLEEPIGNVAYHIKVLARIGAIEEVKTEPVRGALQHFYRATMRPWFDDEMWAELPIPARRAIFGEILQDIWSDVVAAYEEGKLDHDTTHITRTWADLDQRAYDEVVDLLNSVVERVLELHAEAAPRLAQLPDDERDEHSIAVMLMQFHRASKR